MFKTVHGVVKEAGAIATISYVPLPVTTEAILEDIDLIACITIDNPQHDIVKFQHQLLRQNISRLVGSNCPGAIGEYEDHIHTQTCD